MEKRADLPPAALITFGVMLAIIFAARRPGLWQGQHAAPSADSAQVAAVIVDPSALNRLSKQVGKLVAAIDNLIEVGEALESTQSHRATVINRIREEVRILREIGRR